MNIVTTFTELQISNEIVRAMKDMGWEEPTPVQIAAIPVGLKGADMYAQAQTGTGKTGTYGSIILERVMPGTRDVSALVLVPTRELANQVSQELDKLSRYTGHRCLPIYGGVGIEPQIAKLRRGTDIVVATPGRAKDLINRSDLDLSKVSVVVLDEADRMLDMGFARDLNFILSKVPKRRQSLLFSATMSPEIRELAMRQMVRPKEILVSRDEPVLDLTSQYYIVTEKENKRDALYTLLDRYEPKAIVFCHTRHKVDQVAKKMKRHNYLAGAIHGDVAQNKREKVLQGFKDGSIRVLVATDVAARGLDIDSVDLVINFDAPNDPDTYVHRIGRTGRAGKEGMSVSIFLPEEHKMVRDLERRTGKPIEKMDIEILHKPEPEVKKLEEVRMSVLASAERPKAKRSGSQGNVASIEINLGNTDRIGKGEIVRLVRGDTDLVSRDVGKITMGDRYTYVEVFRKDAEKVIVSLCDQSFRGKAVRARVV
ncbi:MAG: DEAD/DEAH box helicase [Methanomassiliicoccales archaeon]|nr:DEAD/DEAH box helicase [Methanomassiliicoccales archaeon]